MLEVGSEQTEVASESEFIKHSTGRESWTQVTRNAKQVDNDVLQGLNDPVWRQTELMETGVLFESMPLEGAPVEKEIPDGPKDIKTTVWYGRLVASKGSKAKPKVQRNLLKGSRGAAAVLLLEAVAFMSLASQWSGSWTQRLYGTGQVDVWGVFGAHRAVTIVSGRQG